jgi:tRNA threonylcarbamoyl adenosine modification protein (Sua5/YciO/YrdC/YwlC family)
VATQVVFDPSNPSEHVGIAAKCIRDGFVIIAPHENGYVYLCDAFSEDSVRAMHVLRGDALGVAAQVLIASHLQVEGIARDMTDDARALMKAFWPGALSLTLRPQLGLNWDLGDAGQLDRFSVRMPSHEFLKALITETGPLAVASASMAGHDPMLEISQLNLQGHEVALVIDSGVITPVQRSSQVEIELTATRLLREGAISQSEIQKVIPALVISQG